MPASTSVRQELVDCIARHVERKGEAPTVVRMTLTKYLRLGAELGGCLKRVGSTRIEFFLSDSERRNSLDQVSFDRPHNFNCRCELPPIMKKESPRA